MGFVTSSSRGLCFPPSAGATRAKALDVREGKAGGSWSSEDISLYLLEVLTLSFSSVQFTILPNSVRKGSL